MVINKMNERRWWNMNVGELRGAIYRKFPSQKAFAYAIGWSPNQVCRLMQGRVDPRKSDISKIVEALELDEKSAFDIFMR